MTVFLTKGAGKVGYTCVEVCNPALYIKINSKRIKIKIYNLIASNYYWITSGKLQNIDISKDFLEKNSVIQAVKRKNGHMRLHEPKSFCTAEETVNKVKSSQQNGRKYFNLYTGKIINIGYIQSSRN